MGPETLRTLLAQMRPADLGMGKAGWASVMRRWIVFSSSC